MSEDQDKYIAEVVEKALRGDMDAINNIEDRVTRSKAKAALIKAKRLSKTAAAEACRRNSTNGYNSDRKIIEPKSGRILGKEILRFNRF